MVEETAPRSTGAGSFGEQLRMLREAAGLSQEELAELAGLSADAVGMLERGSRSHPYPATVRALADALQIGPEVRAELLGAVPRRRTARRDRKPGSAAMRGIPDSRCDTLYSGARVMSRPCSPCSSMPRYGW